MRWVNSDGSPMTPGEIVATTYAKFEPRPLWDIDRLRGMKLDHPPRLYCSICGKHDTVDYIETAKKWHCRSCKGWAARPSILRKKGDIKAKQSQGTRDKDWTIVDGLEAGRVMTAVENLPPAAESWTLWVHTQHCQTAHQTVVVNEAMRHVNRQGKELPSDGIKIFWLAVMLADNARESMRNGGKAHSLGHIARELGIPQSELSGIRKWGRLSSLIDGVYDGLDRQMASAVIRAIQPLHLAKNVG